MSAPLSVRLLLALREDAASAATVLVRLASPDYKLPVRPEDIGVVTRSSDGRWGATLRHLLPGIGTWGGDDGCESQIDALVSLIERTNEEIERRGNNYSDLLERAESDASAVTLYRGLVVEGLRGLGAALERLDNEGECPLAAEGVSALLGAAS